MARWARENGIMRSLQDGRCVSKVTSDTFVTGSSAVTAFPSSMPGSLPSFSRLDSRRAAVFTWASLRGRVRTGHG